MGKGEARNVPDVSRGPGLIRPKAERDTERPTEDDLAREHLGGTRGDPSLREAPMTEQRRKKTFPKDENDGHVA